MENMKRRATGKLFSLAMEMQTALFHIHIIIHRERERERENGNGARKNSVYVVLVCCIWSDPIFEMHTREVSKKFLN